MTSLIDMSDEYNKLFPCLVTALRLPVVVKSHFSMRFENYLKYSIFAMEWRRFSKPVFKTSPIRREF